MIPDSGERTQFNTGAARDCAYGKGRYDLLPVAAIKALSRRLEDGAIKYSDRNWEKGIPLSRFLDSGLRHFFQLLDGDTTEDHAAAVLWNVAGYISTLDWIERGVLPPTLDDRCQR